MTVIIKEHKNGSAEIIRNVPHGKAAQVVEKWQKASVHYQVHGTLPAITWKVAESDNVIKAMIESANL